MLQAQEVSIPVSKTTCITLSNTNTLTDMAVCLGKQKETWRESREIITKGKRV